MSIRQRDCPRLPPTKISFKVFELHRHRLCLTLVSNNDVSSVALQYNTQVINGGLKNGQSWNGSFLDAIYGES